MRLFLQDVRNVDLLIDIALNIGELFRRVRRVALEDDLVVVAALLHFAEIESLVDVVGLGYRELWQSLLEVWVEWSRVN